MDVIGRVTHVHRDPLSERYGAPERVPFDRPLRARRLPDLPLVISELPRLGRFAG